MLHHIALHNVALHTYIASHHTTTHHITSHHTISHLVTTHTYMHAPHCIDAYMQTSYTYNRHARIYTDMHTCTHTYHTCVHRIHVHIYVTPRCNTIR